jgi:hypothetical protein
MSFLIHSFHRERTIDEYKRLLANEAVARGQKGYRRCPTPQRGHAHWIAPLKGKTGCNSSLKDAIKDTERSEEEPKEMTVFLGWKTIRRVTFTGS